MKYMLMFLLLSNTYTQASQLRSGTLTRIEFNGNFGCEERWNLRITSGPGVIAFDTTLLKKVKSLVGKNVVIEIEDQSSLSYCNPDYILKSIKQQ